MTLLIEVLAPHFLLMTWAHLVGDDESGIRNPHPGEVIIPMKPEHMGVSKNSGFSPQIIHFNRDFHYKSSILGYTYFWKPLYLNMASRQWTELWLCPWLQFFICRFLFRTFSGKVTGPSRHPNIVELLEVACGRFRHIRMWFSLGYPGTLVGLPARKTAVVTMWAPS